jgi:CRISPR-associated protein Csx17
MSRHILTGLRPEPLSSYLAGLGMIRLLGEQADPAATAAWSPGGLVIETTVDDLAAWLANQYEPTPVLSPWNGGSGFGAKDIEPKRRLAGLQAHPSPRLAPFRAAIEVADRVGSRARAEGWIGDGGKSQDKGRAVQEFRNRCPDALLPWIDAAVVLADDKAFFPPLLGTGGNDGRLDFSTNFHERLLEVLDPTPKGTARSLACARDLLAGTQAERLANAAVGQFDPAGTGGQASSPFGAAASLVNPWAYVLLIEGALLFASGTVRRHQHAAGRAAMPFTVSFSPDGSSSGAAGEEKTSRGEVWAPVWTRAWTLAEIRQLFGEARASWQGRPARRAVDFYAATRTLGVARGIERFVRYGLQQRNGLAFVAVPVDEVQVHERPEVHLVAQLEDWVSQARGAGTSAAVSGALRRFDAAQLAYARDGGPRRLALLLAALTGLEQAVGRSGGAREKVGVRRAPPAQLFLNELAKSECPEFRVAVGIASCATRTGVGPARNMRQILLPADPPDPADRASRAHRNGRWRESPVVAGFGLRPLRHVLADVLAWRCRTAAAEVGQEGFRGVPSFRDGVPVPAADLHAFAAGLLDDAELDLLLRACLALDWRNVRPAWSASDLVPPGPTLGLLQPLAHGLTPRPSDLTPRPSDLTPRHTGLAPAPQQAGPDHASRHADSDVPRLALSPDWANRLIAGQVTAVHREAVARLRQAGWLAVPALPGLAEDGISIAAALVPRCLRALDLMEGHFAIRIVEEAASGTETLAAADSPEFLSTDTPQLAQELS